MKMSTLLAARRKRSRCATSPSRRLGLERLEDRLALAGILPVSIAHPAGSSPVTGNAASLQGSVSADGRYVAYLSNASNLVAGQDDTIVEGSSFQDVFLYDSLTKTTKLVSGSQGSTTKTGDNESVAAAISADGRYVAFTSRASDLVVGQNEPEGAANSGHLDLFLYDRDATSAAGRIRLVSHASDSATTPANNAVADRTPSISADGRRIAFISQASNMVGGVTDDQGTDVFLFDRGDSQMPPSIKLVSRSATLPATGTDSFFVDEVTLSADGNYVVFQSASTDLVANQTDTNGHADIFLFDATTDTNSLVSGAEGSDKTTGNAPSFQAGPLAISAHGRYVAFKSFATNLVPGQIDTNNNADLFLFDRDATTAADRLKLISHAHGSVLTAATGGSAASEIPVINVDLANNETSDVGLAIAFQSTATNLASGVTDEGTRRDLFVYDVSAGENTLITHTASSFVVPATTASPNIHSVDNTVGRTPVVSRDGQYIAYSSPATDLVTDQDDSDLIITNDVFRYDRLTGRSVLLSGAQGSATQTGDAAADVKGIGADGLIVVFTSDATDLIDDDTNTNPDVFVSVTQPPLTFEFRGRPIDLLSSNMLNAQDGVRDGYFAVNRPFGQGDAEITSLDLERNDGTRWSTGAIFTDRILGVSDSLVTANFSGVESTISTFDGDEFALFAADASAADTLFTVGAQFKLTVGFADRPTVVIHSPPIPGPRLEYNGKLRDRVGRGETALSPDGQKDGTFTLTLQPGIGKVTSLDLDRGDGNRWNTIPDDTFVVLGTAASLDDALLNNSNSSLPTDEALNFLNHGGSLTLFAPEDRPEATSFFTIGKTFTVTVGYDDGSFQEASVLLTSENVPPPRPDLAVSITDAPDPVAQFVAQFQVSIHTVKVRNNGDAPATNVQLRTDRLDQLTSNGFPVSVDFSRADSSPSCDRVGSRVICTLATIAPGTETSVDIAYMFNTARNTTIGVTASATESDLNAADDSDSETTQVVGAVETSLSASSEEIEFAAGLAEELTYTITVTNTNPLPVGDLVITNRLPDNVTLVEVRNTSCEVVAAVFTCRLAQLDPNEAAPLRYVVRPQQVGTIENHGVAVKQGNLVLGGTGSIDVTVVPPADTDGDGLYDAWETNGVDVNSDGIVDLNLPAMGARPDHKDLFVEVDYMSCVAGGCGVLVLRDQKPIAGAIEGVQAAFAAAPVNNPDGSLGINLHVLVDEAVPEIQTVRFTTRGPGHMDDFDDLKLGSNSVSIPGDACGNRAWDGHFGTATDRSSSNCFNILLARYATFRYTIFGYDFAEEAGSSGIAERGGNDFLVTIGQSDEFSIKAIGGSQNLSVARRNVEAATFMHELGHTLGLLHGGHQFYNGADGLPNTADDLDVGLKPNYLSVMNYNLQFPNLDPTRPLDYSRQALPDLNESSLDETRGISGPAGRIAIYSRFIFDDEGNITTITVKNPANLTIDWNLDEDFGDRAVAGDVNVDGLLRTLEGSDDWQNLQYDFRSSADFADGARVTIGDDTVTIEELAARAASFDFDGDGLNNAVDNCSAVVNPDQLDGNEDGLGDVCDLPELLDSLQFSTDGYTVAENGGSALIAVTRMGTGIGRVSVQFATEDDTATAGSDYTATTGMLTFESGELSKTFTVPIAIDTSTEVLEKLKLKLSMPGGIVRLGNQTTAELSITAPAFPWQNPRDRLDSNADGSVSAVDALIPINELNAPSITGTGGMLPAPPAIGIPFYFDISGDGFVSPIDPLLVINFLNDPPSSEAESQAKSPASDVRSSPLLHPVALPLAPARSASSVARNNNLPSLALVVGQMSLPVTTLRDELTSDELELAASIGPLATDFRDLADALFAHFDEWND